jgi:6-phosphogluconolactonase
VQNQHTIAAELGAKQAANLYARLIDDIGQLDIVVLGMGEDGHTASLFPGNAALQDPHSVVPVFAAPKPPPERVSLGVSALRAASQRIALVTGAGKREALRQIKAGAPLPINCIGMIRWFIDTAADAS